MGAIALVGAFVAWRFLPARATDETYADEAYAEVAEVASVRQPVSVRPTGQLSPVPPRPQ